MTDNGVKCSHFLHVVVLGDKSLGRITDCLPNVYFRLGLLLKFDTAYHQSAWSQVPGRLMAPQLRGVGPVEGWQLSPAWYGQETHWGTTRTWTKWCRWGRSKWWVCQLVNFFTDMALRCSTFSLPLILVITF